MIVGTAGHIDHGKTTLVRALTGVDTDRLAEEKRRGITIELGFAPLVLDGVGTVGVVDVPGHEAFVRTMLAGAGGIDVGLLVIAADDGVRPQTREHLTILELLGVRRGVVALSKCDLVDRDWVDLVEEEVRTLVRGTAFEHAPVVRVSPGDEGALAAVRAALAAALGAAAVREADELFRLPVDRAFSVRGTGTVVTGTTWSGTLAADAEVRVLPSGRRARVRGIQVHGQRADGARPAQRTAVALAGIDVSDMHRGDVLVTDSAWQPARAVRADVTLLADAPAALGPRRSVRFHLGTSEVGARVVAQGGAVEPGTTRAARLVLDAPVVARAGDRFVLRAASPLATIGGGTITDAQATRRSKPFPAPRLAVADRLRALLDEVGPRGVDRDSLIVRIAASRHVLDEAMAAAGAVAVQGSSRLVGTAAFDGERARLLDHVDHHHETNPLSHGVSLQELRTRLRLPPEFTQALVDRGVSEGDIEIEGGEVRRRGWKPALTAAQETDVVALVKRLSAAGWEPPSVPELSAELGVDCAPLLRVASRRGSVVQVADDRYYTPDNLSQIVKSLGERFQPGTSLTPTEAREQLGVSRKFLIPLLEHFDAVGITLRGPEGRLWRGRDAPP